MSKIVTIQNPYQTSNRLRLISLGLVLIGVLISGYLSYAALTNTVTICANEGSLDCEVVQNSVYAKFAGIPVAYLGLASYLVIGLILLFENRVSLLANYGIALNFAIVLFGFFFSMWLFYVQAVLLQSFCQWCLLHELNFTILFLISVVRLVLYLRS
ncbi:hypothetical protein MASR2M15_14880 [Anaerolineales bacterium]